jgi:hypothetical protein
MKIRFEAHSPLTPMSAIGAVYGRERTALFAIEILPVHAVSASILTVIKSNRSFRSES